MRWIASGLTQDPRIDARASSARRFGGMQGIELSCSDDGLRVGGWLTLDWLLSRHFEARLDAIARMESGSQLLARFYTYF